MSCNCSMQSCTQPYTHERGAPKTFQGRNTLALYVSIGLNRANPVELPHTNVLQIMNSPYLLDLLWVAKIFLQLSIYLFEIYQAQDSWIASSARSNVTIILQYVISLVVQVEFTSLEKKPLLKWSILIWKYAKIHNIQTRECKVISLVYCLSFRQWVNQA